MKTDSLRFQTGNTYRQYDNIYGMLTGIPHQLIIAFAVDVCIGDPRWIPHPVRLIGRLIEFLDMRLRRPLRSPRFNLIAGALAVLVTVGLTYLAAYVLVDVILSPLRSYVFFSRVSLYDIVIGAAGSLVLAQNDLIKSVVLVRDKLEEADLSEAKAALSMIVGRDTQPLSREGIARAAIETAAENTSDGIIAPLFYFAIGGLPLALAYKAVNTLDSMIGYKNEKYMYFGRGAARLDDVANYIPARLSGIIMVLAVFAITITKLLPYKAKGTQSMSIDGSGLMEGCRTADSRGCLQSATDSLTIMLKDSKNHSSPNSGIPEAAMAGALGVRLGGPLLYGGRLVEKPYIGRADKPVNASKITSAALITAVSSYIGLAAAVAVSCVIAYLRQGIV